MTSTLRALPTFIALSAWLLTALPAHADVMGVQLFVDGRLVGTESVEPAPNAAVPLAFDAANAGFQIDGVAFLDVDPFIDFNLTAINFGGTPTSFAFLFSSPYTGGPYNTLLSEFSSDVTDFGGDGAADVVPLASGFMSLPQIDGVNVLAAALGDGCSPVMAPGSTVACDPFSTASVGVATLPDGQFGVLIALTLSGGDAVTVAGRVELLNEVPEPVSALLVGLGLSVLAMRRRRSR